MKAGAYDYLTTPVHPEELLLLIERALEHRRLLAEVRTLRSSLDEKYGIRREQPEKTGTAPEDES